MSRLLSLRQWLIPFVIGAILIGGTVSTALVVPSFVSNAHAQNTLTTEDLLNEDFTESTGLGQSNIKRTIGNVIKVLLGFLGIVAVVIILYGGLIWMTARGNEENVKKAQQIIVAGAIGLAIILSAFAITQFVVSEFLNATQDSLLE